MSNDRPLHLDVGVPSGSQWGASQQGASKEPNVRQGLQQDQERLEQLVASPQQAASGSHARADQPPSTPSPFDLFRPTQGHTVTPSATPVSPHPHAEPSLDAMLQSMVGRLLVNDGYSGRRAVHLQIDDAQWPGVELQVFEAEGLLTALFTCSSENSRLKLCRQAPWLAEQLSQKLQRATCVQVQTDDPTAPCLEQALSQGL